MRGMFIALMVMGAVWTGGLVWSVLGGMVLVPSATVLSIGSARTAAPAAPAQGLCLMGVRYEGLEWC